jgi:tripartite-type tricarboxylate transporter receptor subunit TctC
MLELLIIFWRSILPGKAPAGRKDYATRLITLINPFARGGGIDISFQPSVKMLGLEIK